MTATRRATILLWTAAFACLAAAALAIASPWLSPVHSPVAREVPAAPTHTSDALDPAPPALAEFEPIFQLDLRGPLVEPMPSPVAAAAPLGQMPVPSNLTLIGTVVEPGHSYGIFQVGPAAVEVRGVGQKTSTGAEVLEITTKTAKVMYDGRVTPLALADAAKPSSTTALNNILAQIAERRAQIRANGGLVPELAADASADDAETGDEPEEPEEIVQPNLVGGKGKDPE